MLSFIYNNFDALQYFLIDNEKEFQICMILIFFLKGYIYSCMKKIKLFETTIRT